MKIAKSFFLIFSIAALIFFTGCESKVSVKFLQNQSVQITYDLKIGQSVLNFIKSFSQMDTSSSDAAIFDIQQIKDELFSIGARNVTVSSANSKSLNISATVPLSEDSMLLQSGCITKDGNIVLSAKTLLSFYELLPEAIQQYVDLFMAPVFVGDVMLQNEYIELIHSVYGIDFANEIKASNIFVQVQKDGKSINKKIPLVEFLTLNDNQSISF